MEPLEHGVANSCKSVFNYRKSNMGLQTFANQFLNMELLEHGVENSFKSVSKYCTVGTRGFAHSCKAVSKYGTIGTWGFKQMQIEFLIWNC